MGFPHLAVVSPAGVVGEGFGDDEVDEGIDVDPRLDKGPASGCVDVVIINKIQQLNPIGSGALMCSESGGRTGEVSVSDVVIFANADAVFFEDPLFGPPGANVVDAPVFSVEEDDGGAHGVGFGIDEIVGNAVPHTVAKHGIVPVVAAFAECKGGVVWDAGTGEEIVF